MRKKRVALEGAVAPGDLKVAFTLDSPCWCK